MSRARMPTVLVIALAIVGVAACGVPMQRSATKVDKKDVPFELLDKKSSAKSSESAGNEDLVVYFATAERLVPASRRLPPPVTLEDVLSVLRKGPTSAEEATGVRSALPIGSVVGSVSLNGGTATVDLARPFTALSSSDQLLALAQLVYTLTARPGVGQVQFTLEGTSTEVPRGNGALTTAPVSRDDYLDAAPAG
jgi:spore germination protein GerM